MNVAGGVHARGRVDHHGDEGTDETARSGQRVGLMKPDAHWDIILTSCRQKGAPPLVNVNTSHSGVVVVVVVYNHEDP